ncbi:MAG: hypothetical protein ACOH1O_03060 [Flavobacterium sp.]
MQKTFHLSSAQEVNAEILNAIKVAFKSRPITITVEEDENDYEITSEMKSVLDNRIQEDESTYLTAEESIRKLNKKYSL